MGDATVWYDCGVNLDIQQRERGYVGGLRKEIFGFCRIQEIIDGLTLKQYHYQGGWNYPLTRVQISQLFSMVNGIG